MREDDPSQEQPELSINCPRLPIHTKMSTVDRNMKGHRTEGESENTGERGGDFLPKHVTQYLIGKV